MRSSVGADVPPSLVVTEPDGTFTVQLTADRITFGRSPDSDIRVHASFVSKRHGVLERAGHTYRFVHLGETNPTVIDGSPVRERTLQNGDSLRIGSGDGLSVTLLFVNPAAPGQKSVPVEAHRTPDGERSSMVRATLGTADVLNIGRGPANDLVLSSMLVSRKHAEVARRGDSYVLKDLNSSNGTFLNGVQIGEQALRDGDSIRIGPYKLLYAAGRIQGYNEERTVRLDALNVGKTIGTTRIVSGVSFSVLPGELVGIIGTSGSGKSTLMDTLNGVRPATEGRVLVNGVDLYERFDSVRPLMGYVPQFSILHDMLPLERALYYTGRLRFADDVTDDEVHRKVRDVMQALQIDHRAAVPVGRLSGGQQKRASLAAELLTEPGLLFLDEPTTGLDAGLTRRLMEKFRDLADEGRTVVLVTHDTESLELCDLIVFLASGNLVYIGRPADAPPFFGATDLGDVYSTVEDRDNLDRWRSKCLDSDEYEKFVSIRQGGAAADLSGYSYTSTDIVPGTGNVGLSGLRQFMLLVRRYTELILRDARTLALLLLQAPFLATLLILISQPDGFRYATGLGGSPPPGDPCDSPTLFGCLPEDVKPLVLPSLPLLMAASVTWFGAINAAREIVKEVPVFRRERLAGLKTPPYLLSKVMVLGTLCVVQASLFFLVIVVDTDIPRDGVLTSGYLEVYATLLLTCLASLGLGLLISALSPNADRAQSLVPLILIPQLIFARVGEDAHVAVQVVAYSSISRWAFEALGSTGWVQGSGFGHSAEYLLIRWIGLTVIAVGLMALTGVLVWRRRLA